MARKSRRTVAATPAVDNIEAAYYPTAIYARLSVENSGKDDDGESIANQITFCKDYIKGIDDLKLMDIYQDNGETGTAFERPEFQRLMDDVRGGRIKCIVVKDLSRFGRNYLEAGEYLEKIFPFMGIRFIAITDGYDSLTSGDAEQALMLPLKNMINDVYAKDISRKIITSFKARMERGEFLPPNPPYGYVKSETKEYRYEIDPVAAPIVRSIYEWIADGISYTEIKSRLEEMKASSPAVRKLELGIWKAERYRNAKWNNHTISDIATNPTYIGSLVFGKMSKALYQGITKAHRNPKDEWLILPDMHEPIVDKELFNRVQTIMSTRKATFQEKVKSTEKARNAFPNLLKGKIYCGCCGKRMKSWLSRDKYGNYAYLYYVCGGYGDTGTKKTFHKSDDVYAGVFASIRVQIELALDHEKMMDRLKGTNEERNLLEQYQSEYNNALREVEKLTVKREGLYENFIEGILTEEEYRFAKKHYEEQAALLQQRLDKAKENKDKLECVLSGNNEWIMSMHRIESAEGLDQAMADDLVKKVTAYEDHRIDVELNYGDEEAAETVRKIFEYALEGMNSSSIARKLNEKGLETPGQYYRRNNPDHKNFKNQSRELAWYATMVRNILTQEMYYGAVVGHKREKVVPCGKTTRAVPKDKQIIIEGCHDPIVSKEEWLKAQEVIRPMKSPERTGGRNYPLKGVVRCGCCGRKLQYNNDQRKTPLFKCVASLNNPNAECYKKRMPAVPINDAVFEAIQRMMECMDTVEQKAKKASRISVDQSVDAVKQIRGLQMELESCEAQKMDNIERLNTGEITKEKYLEERTALNERVVTLKKALEEMQKRKQEADATEDPEFERFLDAGEKYRHQTELTNEMVKAFVDTVLIYEPGRIEIKWKFSDKVLSMMN